MTYEERIIYYAKMHADKFKQGVGDEGSEILFITESEVTCAAAAEDIRKFNKSLSIPQSWCEQYLIENGYIPLPEQEAGDDDTNKSNP